jgi:uncharacterized phage protein gp47/JayE
MSLNTPETAAEIDQRAKVDVGRVLAASNPFLRNSWLGALVTAFANRIFDFYFALRQAEREAIPDTAVDRLEQWASIWSIIRNPATIATGRIAVGGTAPSDPVAIGTIFASSDGIEYETTGAGSVATQSLSVASITRTGSIATLTTVSDHLLGSNITITITGANEAEYNVIDSVCTVTGAKTLTYAVTGAPVTPATGTILLGCDMVSLPVDSVEFGADQNQAADSVLTIQSPVSGVDDDVNVDASTLGGGTDQETGIALRLRLLERIQNPIAHFNVNEITQVAKTISGVTRVFVEEITPVVGQCTIYFMRDNDDDPIPDGTEVAAVKAVVDAIKPANSDTLDIIVAAPSPQSEDFTFSDLQPATSTMEVAVTASLVEFFANRTTVGVNVDADAYRSAIFNTVDTVTGEVVTTFTLTTPTTDLVIASGEIATLGNMTYP